MSYCKNFYNGNRSDENMEGKQNTLLSAINLPLPEEHQ